MPFPTVQATAVLTVSPQNDAPVAPADVYTIDGDTSLTVAADLGVLANDSDADGPALTAQHLDTTHREGSTCFT